MTTHWHKPSQIKNPALIVICFCLFMFGLAIPTISTAFVLAPIAIIAIFGSLGTIINERSIYLSALLFAALCLHQLTSFMQYLIPFPAAMKGIFFSVFCYWTGYALPVENKSENEKIFSIVLASITLGFITLAFGSVIKTGFPMKGLTFDGGAINFIEGTRLHKTHVGIYASLALCWLPIVIFTSPAEKGNKTYWVLALLFSIAGFSANMAMKNRTPVLALALSLAAASAVILYRNVKSGISIKYLTRLFLITPAFLALMGGIYIALSSVSDVAFAQFQRGGLETPRYIVWRTILSHFFDHFWGGQKIVIIESFAHDYWLDILWDAGIPAFTAMLAFHIIHFYMSLRVIDGQSTRFTLITLGFWCSYLLSFLVEPVAAASLYYTCGSLVFFGMCARIRHMNKPAPKTSLFP
jgi:hypothetical protein